MMKRQTHICSAMFVADYVAMGLPLPRLCQCPYRTGPNGSCDIEFWALRTKRFSAGVTPGVCTSQHVMRVVRPYGSLKQHKIRLWKVTRSNGKKAFATRAVIRFFRLMREKRTQQQLELYMSTLPLGHKVLRSRWDAIAFPSSQTPHKRCYAIPGYTVIFFSFRLLPYPPFGQWHSLKKKCHSLNKTELSVNFCTSF